MIDYTRSCVRQCKSVSITSENSDVWFYLFAQTMPSPFSGPTSGRWQDMCTDWAHTLARRIQHRIFGQWPPMTSAAVHCVRSNSEQTSCGQNSCPVDCVMNATCLHKETRASGIYRWSSDVCWTLALSFFNVGSTVVLEAVSRARL